MEERVSELRTPFGGRFEGLEEKVKGHVRRHAAGYAIGSLGWVFFAVLLWNDYVVFGPGFFRYVLTWGEFPRHLAAFLLIPLTMSMGYFYESLHDAQVYLNEDERRYRSIVEDSGDAILTLNRAGKITSCNKTASKLFGYSRKEITGSTLSLLLTSKHVEDIEGILKQAEKDQMRSCEGQIITKKGKIIDFLMTLSPLRNLEGETVGAACIIKNVTVEKKQGDERERSLEEILNTITEQISVIDKDFRILSFNKAFAEATGCPEGKIIGKKCYEVIHGCSDKEFETICRDRCLVKRAFETGELVEDVHEHDEDGRVVYHEVRALPSKNADGEVYRVVYLVKDVTKRKKMENKLVGYSEELEYSNKLKELLLDILSHDLINPLTVVKTASEFLCDEGDLKGKEEVQIITESANKLERIIKDAMICAHLESHETLDFREDDLVQLLKDAAYGYHDRAGERGMEIVIEAEEGCMAEVTPFMSEAFSNLISNAVKFGNPNSKIMINVECEEDSWKISVKDYGDSIPDDYKGAIFERFKRVDKFGGAKGTGLGLAIVDRIVKMHEGSVWVEDNAEGGSIFYIKIPAKHSV